MELVRLALPRRVFTLSQVNYAVDRIAWLYAHRDLIGGLRFVEEPEILRFFYGRLEPIGNWVSDLADAFRARPRRQPVGPGRRTAGRARSRRLPQPR